MKKPYFNLEQRNIIRLCPETFSAVFLNLDLSYAKLERKKYKELGFIKGWFFLKLKR